jgi:riboflavin synthase
MFTGIIEAVGTVRSVRSAAAGKIVGIDLGPLARGAGTGDSIAINGVCLTISRLSGSVADFDVSAETLAKSTIGGLQAAAAVNLERAMAADGRFGGHMVLGHVDGTARIEAIDRHGDFCEMRFAAATELLDEMVTKGSVAVDGISLTIASLDEKGFSIALIPTTLRETALGTAKVGDVVNIETDMLIKAVRKYLGKIAGPRQGLTIEKLRERGF